MNNKRLSYDYELEKAVLGAVISESDALYTILDMLKPVIFYSEFNRKVAQAILQMVDQNSSVDMLTVTEKLRASGVEGNVAYKVAELTMRVNSAANVKYHIRLLQQMWVKRELHRMGQELINRTADDTEDSIDLLERAEAFIGKISDFQDGKTTFTISESIETTYFEIEETISNMQKGIVPGISTGFESLDVLTGGWKQGHLIYLAARPGMGKTGMALSYALNAVQNGVPTLFVSLEMPHHELTKRLISQMSGVNLSKIIHGHLNGHEIEKLKEVGIKLGKSNLIYEDAPGISLGQLNVKVAKAVNRYGIKLVIVDYLQLMKTGKSQNREQEVSKLSSGLKHIAREYSVPVIALSQLSRDVEKRGGDKRPQLSDLRDSGSLEQDADMVQFLYRPEYYGITQNEDGDSVEGYTELIVAKQRNGPIQTVALEYTKKTTRFINYKSHNKRLADANN